MLREPLYFLTVNILAGFLRFLRRDLTLERSDVNLERTLLASGAVPIHQVDQVLGLATRRAIAAGVAIPQEVLT